MRCLECPALYPINEYEGYCLYSNSQESAGNTCKAMRNAKPRIVNGIPLIPENLDEKVKEKLVRVLKECYGDGGWYCDICRLERAEKR